MSKSFNFAFSVNGNSGRVSSVQNVFSTLDSVNCCEPIETMHDYASDI